MDLFPEIMQGNVGNFAFASGCAEQTPAANNVAELFNPALTGTKQQATGNVPLVTVTGIVADVDTADAKLQIFAAATSTDVNSAATAGPVWLDTRRTDAPVATFKMGSVALPGTFTLLESFRLKFGTQPLILPWNHDIDVATGLLFAITGTNRSSLTVIWTERTKTN